jgi:hypothetical protein
VVRRRSGNLALGDPCGVHGVGSGFRHLEAGGAAEYEGDGDVCTAGTGGAVFCLEDGDGLVGAGAGRVHGDVPSCPQAVDDEHPHLFRVQPGGDLAVR